MQIPKPKKLTKEEQREIRKKKRTALKREAHKRGEYTNSELQDTADSIFSLRIRLRDMAEDGLVTCCTCGKRLPIGDFDNKKGIQNGHSVTRDNYATRYDPDACDGQCWGCNAQHMGNGKMDIHMEYIDRTKGKEVREKIERNAVLWVRGEFHQPPKSVFLRETIFDNYVLVLQLAEEKNFDLTKYQTLLNTCIKITAA